MSISSFLTELPKLLSEYVREGHTLIIFTYIDEVTKKQPYHGSYFVVGTFSNKKKAEKVYNDIKKKLEKKSPACTKLHFVVISNGHWGILRPGENRQISAEAKEYADLLDEQSKNEEERQRLLSDEIDKETRESDDITTVSGAIYNWYCLVQNYLYLKRYSEQVKEVKHLYDEQRSKLSECRIESGEWTLEIHERLKKREEEHIAEQVVVTASEVTNGTMCANILPSADEVWTKFMFD